jgi:DNA-nicking Smr family endonuclease
LKARQYTESLLREECGLKGKDDDLELFREAMRGVRPLAQPKRAPTPRRPPPPRARFTRAERAEVLRESLAPPPVELDIQPGESEQHRQPGVPEAVLRRLRRGHYRIEAEIDLHGLTVTEARAQLREFLLEALSQRRQCLRIVHGKGLRSGPRGPVVRNAVIALLRRADSVLAYTSAAIRDGGTGATLVLLRAGNRS